MLESLLFAILYLLGIGALAGFLAGLLGIGGGAIIVPGLYYLFVHFGFDDGAMHTAVGTSLLTILMTGGASAWSHYKNNGVDLSLTKAFIPGIIFGAIAGTGLATLISKDHLKGIFATLQIGFGLYILIRGNNIVLFSHMPRQPMFTLIACINAALATLMGVGGGVQNVLYMTICGIPLHRAIGTAAALGPIIALIGTIGFITIGQNSPFTLPYSTGFIHWPTFFIIILTSVATAPIGARCTHTWPKQKIKKIFTLFLFCISIKMLVEVMMY